MQENSKKHAHTADYPKVQITPSGKAVAIEPETIEKPEKPFRKVSEAKKKTYVLLGLICAAIILGIYILTLSGKPMCRLMPKPEASALKVQQLHTLNQNERRVIFAPYKVKTHNASFVVPLDFLEENVSEEDSVYVKFKTEDESFFLIFNVVLRENAPVELRTFHRLAFENLLAEFDARISKMPQYFTTTSGNKAFETGLSDDDYNYTIVTAASDSAFATLIISNALDRNRTNSAFNALILKQIVQSLYLQ